MTGLARLLATETNVSDFLAYFTENDPGKWAGLVPATPRGALREGGAGSRRRADLILQGRDGAVVGAVEVKLGHHMDAGQAEWYESTFDPAVPLILASLDASDARREGSAGRWEHISIVDLVGRWIRSDNEEVSVIAGAALRVLEEWANVIEAVAAGRKSEAALPLDRIRDPFLARVLTRTLVPALHAAGADEAYPGTTSGGGNAILQCWKQLPCAPNGHSAITEVRWAPARQVMDFRFGLDFGASDRTSRAAVWELAGQLDDVIRTDRFIEHLRLVDPDRAGLLSSKRSSGRPPPKGDWAEIVERGFLRGDAANFNPGFLRDGDTRLQAAARIDTARATGPDVIALLTAALDYLVTAR